MSIKKIRPSPNWYTATAYTAAGLEEMQARIYLSLLSALAVVVFAPHARAASQTVSVGPVCADTDCFGVVYTLTIDDSPDVLTFSNHAMLELDLAGYTGFGTHVKSVNFKVSSDVTAFNLTDAPGGVLDWTTIEAPISGAGCGGSEAGFVCSDDNSPATSAPVLGGPAYVWEWDFTPNGAIFENLIGAHIGAKYWSVDHPNGWITSAEAPIPEPNSVILFGVGAFVIAGALRRGSFKQ